MENNITAEMKPGLDNEGKPWLDDTIPMVDPEELKRAIDIWLNTQLFSSEYNLNEPLNLSQ